MKEKVMITVMIGLLSLSFLSTIAWPQTAGLPECQNNLRICTTGLANAQTTLGVCTAGLADAQTNIATAQTNLATCQATLSQCVQQTPPSSFPSWDQKFACDSTSNCPRFEVLADWANEAVLDRETGLVWEQSPSTTIQNWMDARVRCNEKVTAGNRRGWRLPTIQELASLVDPTVTGPALPSGHPFSNVQLTYYWSATTSNSFYPEIAWHVNFDTGIVGGNVKSNDFNHATWCVRGGQGVDPQ